MIVSRAVWTFRARVFVIEFAGCYIPLIVAIHGAVFVAVLAEG
jgi:hypothetical protein